MTEKTSENMRQALADTSLEAARASVLAKLAQKCGRPDAARLLKALALADEAQARRILALARGKLGGLDDGLRYLAQRKAQEDALRLKQEQALAEGRATEAALFGQILQAGRSHAELLTDPDKSPPALFVCQICGYLIHTEAPENCPVCQAVSERFDKVE